MTMNAHWGWNKSDKKWKSTEELVRKLIDIASKGGNFLLNIGPQPDGNLPIEALQRLEGIGHWMDKNSEAIYDTTASPFKEQLAWGRCTRKITKKSTTLYLHVFDWPQDGKLLVPSVKNAVASASFLATGTKLRAAGDANGITVSLPPFALDKISTTIVLNLKGDLDIK
jgi:alpha-L-fucosidase